MRPHGKYARVNPQNPENFAQCDRCGFWRNGSDLVWQDEWSGTHLYNIRILVCSDRCYDRPQEQLRTIILPPDPIRGVFTPRRVGQPRGGGRLRALCSIPCVLASPPPLGGSVRGKHTPLSSPEPAARLRSPPRSWPRRSAAVAKVCRHSCRHRSRQVLADGVLSMC